MYMYNWILSMHNLILVFIPRFGAVLWRYWNLFFKSKPADKLFRQLKNYWFDIFEINYLFLKNNLYIIIIDLINTISFNVCLKNTSLLLFIRICSMSTYIKK